MDTKLVDVVAWAKTCLLITAATKPGTPDREREMAQLREATAQARAAVNAAPAPVPQSLRVEVRVCELAIPKLEAGAILRSHPDLERRRSTVS